jgi:phosphoribosyl 1,2-cyclic phosphodiesterase
MSLAFASLGSGSKGNATLVRAGDDCLLIDCGFSLRETERRLSILGCQGLDIVAILVTHEHSDHLRGVMPLARKYRIPVYMTAGTALESGSDHHSIRPISAHQAFSVAGMDIMPVSVPHDAREPVQFCITHGGKKLGVLTDLGSISGNVVSHYGDCDGLLVEANHDTEMLANGPYPLFLKRRVAGDWGHLNNGQTASLLSLVERRKIQTLVLAHISQKNNRVTLVEKEISSWIGDIGKTVYACQNEGFPWQFIE